MLGKDDSGASTLIAQLLCRILRDRSVTRISDADWGMCNGVTCVPCATPGVDFITRYYSEGPREGGILGDQGSMALHEAAAVWKVWLYKVITIHYWCLLI